MKRYKKQLLILSSIILILTVVILGYKNYSFILNITYPFQKSIYTVFSTFADMKDIFIQNNHILQENKKLRQEIILLKQQVNNLKYVEYENAKLKKLLKYSKSLGLKDIQLARIISFSPNSWEKYIIIDLGEKDKLKVGDLVISNGYLVGKVTDIGKFSSKVTLVNDLDFKIPARTKITREYVFLKGAGKNAILKFVKKNQDIRVGDIIETDSPKGIPIGKVVKVEDYPTEFFKKVEVEPFLKPFTLEYVLVLRLKR